ncbi:MAG: hypothetical protein IKE58_12155 [Blautia sp.]|nr:hypothetical protein [Blautia sp.]
MIRNEQMCYDTKNIPPVRLDDNRTGENTILFITGHSLGAATANVVGRLSRKFAKDEAVFVYSFASPNYETEGEWKKERRLSWMSKE